jgi:hypothetical protein
MQDSSLESSSGVSASEHLTDFTAAIFNQCCAAKGWSRQGEVPLCSSPEAAECTLPSELSSFEEELCFCYSDDKRYQSAWDYVNADDVCSLLTGKASFKRS